MSLTHNVVVAVVEEAVETVAEAVVAAAAAVAVGTGAGVVAAVALDQVAAATSNPTTAAPGVAVLARTASTAEWKVGEILRSAEAEILMAVATMRLMAATTLAERPAGMGEWALRISPRAI
jgi:hypothetical protein